MGYEARLTLRSTARNLRASRKCTHNCPTIEVHYDDSRERLTRCQADYITAWWPDVRVVMLSPAVESVSQTSENVPPAWPPPDDPMNRRIFEEAGRPECSAIVPKSWQGIVLETVQQLKRECPSIRFLQIKEKFGGLRIYFGADPSEVARASEIIADATRVIDERRVKR